MSPDVEPEIRLGNNEIYVFESRGSKAEFGTRKSTCSTLSLTALCPLLICQLGSELRGNLYRHTAPANSLCAKSFV